MTVFVGPPRPQGSQPPRAPSHQIIARCLTCGTNTHPFLPFRVFPSYVLLHGIIPLNAWGAVDAATECAAWGFQRGFLFLHGFPKLFRVPAKFSGATTLACWDRVPFWIVRVRQSPDNLPLVFRDLNWASSYTSAAETEKIPFSNSFVPPASYSAFSEAYIAEVFANSNQKCLPKPLSLGPRLTFTRDWPGEPPWFSGNVQTFINPKMITASIQRGTIPGPGEKNKYCKITCWRIRENHLPLLICQNTQRMTPCNHVSLDIVGRIGIKSHQVILKYLLSVKI